MDIALLSPAITTDFVAESFYNVQTFGLAKSLARRGHNLMIYTIRKPGDPQSRQLPEGDNEDGSGTTKVNYMRSVVPLPRRELLTPSVLREIRGDAYDVVQVAEDGTLTSYMVAAFRRSFNGSFVISQGLYRTPSNRFAHFYSLVGEATFNGRMCESADLVIAKTDAACQYMRSKGHRNVITIPVGVDTDVFAPLDRSRCRAELGIDEDEIVLLHVGAIAPHRDIESCVTALSRLRKKGRDVRLLLVGTGSHERPLTALARTLGVEDRVKFLGRVSNSALPTVYGASDVTLLPMRREALFIFGMVIPESLACGVPVVSVPVPAAVDHIHEGVSGRIVEHENPEMLANTLESLLTAEDVLPSLSKTSREYCLRNLDWGILADRYADSYRTARQV